MSKTLPDKTAPIMQGKTDKSVKLGVKMKEMGKNLARAMNQKGKK